MEREFLGNAVKLIYKMYDIIYNGFGIRFLKGGRLR